MSKQQKSNSVMTIVLEYPSNQPKKTSIGDIEKLTGATWVAGSAFNAVHALEIAQEALERLRAVGADNVATDALDKIESMEMRLSEGN
ncbi:hypothetical protein CYQ88_08420 [Hydrogenovibrio sp. SC-1]|uniref:hypothetical protein n=1 Tax=Hydrogenovibrio sp. SC-1 TaxID=2065820 RepID=UPI000C798818|nr:hypothetical protein [Hydrogenovibrio sp. SC-1]PLA73979.1 hypothetical protein CYQ88_08420 [Hydrogenovibrio sp. SC-1]